MQQMYEGTGHSTAWAAVPGETPDDAQHRQSASADVRNTPAVALTAFARSEDRTKALRSGFEMHLAKPIDPGELVASVATLVKRARSAQ